MILAAVLFTLLRAAVPYITDYGDAIEEQLSLYLAMPVEIGEVEADISWLVPRLRLIDVSFREKETNRLIVHFDEIDLSLDWIKTIEYMRPELGLISLVGPELWVEYNRDGNLVVQGYEVGVDRQSPTAIPIEVNQLLSSISIYIVNAKIHWQDLQHNGQKLNLTDVNIALINDSPGHTLSVKTALPMHYGKHLEIIVDIEGKLTEPLNWQGRTYFNIDDLQVKKWFDDYWKLLGYSGGGQMNASVWIEWDKQQVNEVNARFDGQQLSFSYKDKDVRSWFLDKFTGDYRWKKNPNGWQLDARNVDIERDQRPWPFPAAASVRMDREKNQLDVQANFARLEGLAYVAGFAASFFENTEFKWDETIEPFKPAGDLYDLNLVVPIDQPNNIKINTRFSDLSYTSPNYIPSVKGLAGRLSFDEKGTRLKLASQHVDLDFNGLFRDPMHLNVISGEMLIYREADSWHLDTEKITAITPHITTQTRLEVSIPDNAPAFINLISKYKQGNAAFTRSYLPTAIMGDDVVSWLDNSIVNGDITQGGYLLYGNLEDFPFNQHQGVMEALFNVENMRLKYQPDWPALEALSAEVCFYGKSMDIQDAEGKLYGGGFKNTRVQINDMSSPRLDLSGEVYAPLSDMLAYVGDSPLADKLGSYLLGFKTRGDADLLLEFKLPLSGDDEMKLNGTLGFKGNEVYLPEQDYRLKGLSGDLAFTESATTASDLKVSLDGFPLSIDVATKQMQQNFLTKVGVKGYAPASSVLAPVPKLRDYISGGANWDVDIQIRQGDDREADVDVLLNSDLKGVATEFPGPFKKEKEQELPLKLHVGLVGEDELNIDFVYGASTTFRGKRSNLKWDVELKADAISGKAHFAENFQQSDNVMLEVDYLDANAFIEKSDDAMDDIQLAPQDVPSLDIKVKTIDWKKLKLENLSLQTQRTRSGMTIEHFELHAPSAKIKTKGTWLTSWRYKNTTTLDIEFETEDLGQLLEQLEISKGIRKTDGRIHARWQWHAEPYNFNWQVLQGDADLALRNGQLRDFDPGAGRLLGILNFETLLSLDMGNQVSEGFAFDKMRGSFSFSQGNAYSDDFNIEGKVANIRMEGRIGLSDEDFDQTITVIPGVGSTLTVIGAVTGGPVTAAAVHLFQKIFGIDEIARYTYSVTGPWDNPEVKLLSVPASTEETNNEIDI